MHKQRAIEGKTGAKRRSVLTGALMVFFLSACDEQAAPGEDAYSVPAPTRAVVDYAETAMPADANLASIYERSCFACHSRAGSGAPLTGHAKDWAVRAGQGGLDKLLRSTKQGLNAMPAMGLCNDCSDGELAAIIEFMARDVVQ